MKDFIKYWQSDCDEKELEITKVYVSPENRGKGKGKKLVESAIDYARENGYAKTMFGRIRYILL